MIKVINLSLEDKLSSVITKIKGTMATTVLLVIPKGSVLFADSINMRMLYKQISILRKKVYIMTNDDIGKLYSKEAGFELKSPKAVCSNDKTLKAKPVVQDSKPVVIQERLAKKDEVLSGENSQKDLSHFNLAPKFIKSDADVFGLSSIQSKNLNKKPFAFFTRPAFVIAVLMVFMLSGIAAAFFVPRAELLVKHKRFTLNQKYEVASVDALSNSGNLQVVAYNIDKVFNLSATLDVKGQVDVGEKAKGKVAIYNLTGKKLKIKSSGTTLIVGTRKFVLTKDIDSLKPIDKDKVSDSSLKIDYYDIIAESGGEDYNLPIQTRFEIVSGALGAASKDLYAKSVTEVTGGFTRKVSSVEEVDLIDAKNELAKIAVQRLTEEIRSKGEILIEGAYKAEIIEHTLDKKLKDQSPKISSEGQVRVVGKVYKRSDIQDVARKEMVKKLKSDERLEDSSLDDFTATASANTLDASAMFISLLYKSGYDKIISWDQWPEISKAKTKQAVIESVGKMEGVESAELYVYPAWFPIMPFNSSRIIVIAK